MKIKAASSLRTIPEREWDKLINLVLEGCVVPVLGSEVLSIETDNGEELLYNVWGQNLLDSQAEPIEVTADEKIPLLYQVTNRLSTMQNAGERAGLRHR